MTCIVCNSPMGNTALPPKNWSAFCEVCNRYYWFDGRGMQYRVMMRLGHPDAVRAVPKGCLGVLDWEAA